MVLGLVSRINIRHYPVVKVAKAVITAAGNNQRMLPLQTLVDRDGVSKSALAILAGEITAAGIGEIAVIVCPGDEAAYAAAAGPLARQMRFIPQTEALGYGHAVHCAAEFTANDPFLLMVGDHLYTSRTETILHRPTSRNRRCRKMRGFRRPGHPRKQTSLLRLHRRASRPRFRSTL